MLLLGLTPTLTTLVVILLILVLLGSVPRWGYNRSWGYGPLGLVITAIVVVVLLKLLHVI